MKTKKFVWVLIGTANGLLEFNKLRIEANHGVSTVCPYYVYELGSELENELLTNSHSMHRMYYGTRIEVI